MTQNAPPLAPSSDHKTAAASQKPIIVSLSFLLVLSGSIIILFSFITFFLAQQNRQLSAQLNQVLSQPTAIKTQPPVTTSPDPTASWQTYTDPKSNFEFKYPNKLTLKTNNQEVILNHQIPYPNNGDCDLSGNSKLLDKLDDFNVSFSVIHNYQANPYATDITIGKFKGKAYDEGAEGCGNTIYSFPIDTLQTLVIKRARIQATSGIRTDLEKILAVPGVISKVENEAIFDQILSTFKFID